MEKVLCKVISVDCLENTQSKIENGEPKYIGFDFYVDPFRASYMKNYIISLLNYLNIPYLSVYINGEISCSPNEVFNKNRVMRSIISNESYIKLMYNNTRHR